MKKATIIFLCLILVTSLLVGGLGLALNRLLLTPLGLESQENPIALPFVLLADEVLRAQVEFKLAQANEPPVETTEPTVPETVPATTIPPETTMPTKPPTEPGPVYQAVDESWFDDVLFIGDSRTFGLQSMARLGNADYYCAGSMTIFGIRDCRLSDRNFPAMRLEELLQTKTYGKIYIHLGLNELIAGADAIMAEYLEVIDTIRQYQPDAYIIIQSCMSISDWKGAGKNFPIDQLHKLNDLLRAHAESDPEVFRFCDTNSWAADEEGYIRQEITCDGCHLYGVYYEEWSRWILEDAGWYGIP